MNAEKPVKERKPWDYTRLTWDVRTKSYTGWLKDGTCEEVGQVMVDQAYEYYKMRKEVMVIERERKRS